MENNRRTREEVTKAINKLKERQPSAFLSQCDVYYLAEIFSGGWEDQDDAQGFHYSSNHDVELAVNGSGSSNQVNLANVESDEMEKHEISLAN